MSLLNSWTPRVGLSAVERPALTGLVSCDECLPPRCWPGSATSLRRGGWAFESFEDGPHQCPYCAADGPIGGRPDKRRRAPEADSPSLPNFLIVGAAKCGTSSLHGYLASHPEIQMSAAKELNFFIDPDCLERGPLYESFFDSSVAIRGESSPYYLCDPLAPGVPGRIAEMLGRVRLIAVVRDPVERLVSHYVDDFAGRREQRTFEQAVIAEAEDPYNRYIAPGRYAGQLSGYREVFDSSQILVVDQGRLLNQRQETLARIFDFLDVDPAHTSPDFAGMANTGDGKRLESELHRRMRRLRVGERLQRLPLPAGARDRVIGAAKRSTSRAVSAPSLAPTRRAELQDLYRPEVEQLRRDTGLDLESWLVA
jgi:hypothetical protein